MRSISSGLLTISGGEIVVPTVGNSHGTYANFNMHPSGKLTMSGGTVTIQQANGGAGGDIKIDSGAGSKSITGGTFRVGNASTPASQTMLVNSEIAINNLTVNSANATARLAAVLTLNGSVNISAGALDANNLNMSVAGNWSNSGTFTAGTGKVTFGGGSTSTYGGSSTTTFYDLQINSGTILNVGTSTLFNASNSLRNQGKLKQTQTIGTDNVAFLNVTSGKYYGVEIDPAGSASMGSTAVTVSGEQTCPSPPSLGVTPVKRCFDIAPTTPTTATVKFWYDDANELNGNVAGSVKVYHQESGLWYTENGAYTRGATGGFDWVQVTGVDGYSPFALTSNTPSSPTLITLAFFTATRERDHIIVSWETGSEVDNAGFNLWRATTAVGSYTRINSTLIPAQGTPTQGARYTYADRTALPGIVYWYQLEDVDIYGRHTFHTVLPRASLLVNPLYLPLIQR